VVQVKESGARCLVPPLAWNRCSGADQAQTCSMRSREKKCLRVSNAVLLNRSRISTRNIASVFPSRPRYVLIDTSADNVMLVPGGDGFFR
jgi:hypothetical protein